MILPPESFSSLYTYLMFESSSFVLPMDSMQHLFVSGIIGSGGVCDLSTLHAAVHSLADIESAPEM